jgi:hypothetical protein
MTLTLNRMMMMTLFLVIQATVGWMSGTSISILMILCPMIWGWFAGGGCVYYLFTPCYDLLTAVTQQLHGGCYPTWQSLACDYLAVMASLVSSERSFSSAGIMICKWHNRLDSDIVEALQCLKMLIHQDLLGRDVFSVAEEEAHLDYMDEQQGDMERDDSQYILVSDDADIDRPDGHEE